MTANVPPKAEDTIMVEDVYSDHKLEAHDSMGQFIATPKQVKRLRRKQDLCIATMLSGCYFFAYLVGHHNIHTR
jgi:hypothetical protein